MEMKAYPVRQAQGLVGVQGVWISVSLPNDCVRKRLTQSSEGIRMDLQLQVLPYECEVSVLLDPVRLMDTYAEAAVLAVYVEGVKKLTDLWFQNVYGAAIEALQN